MDQADHHGEGLRPPHRVFQDTAAGEEGRLFIIFDLESGRGRPGFDDRVHVVIPLVDPLMRIGPVGRPGVVGGIDIGGEAFLEPVQLVRPHEMHLARQAGPVAHHAQVMGECWDRGRKLGGIVIGPDLRHQLPGHEACPRRGTKRRVAVGRVEAGAARGQRIHVGRLDHGMAIGAGELRRQLICHDQNDIGRGGHAELLLRGREAPKKPARPCRCPIWLRTGFCTGFKATGFFQNSHRTCRKRRKRCRILVFQRGIPCKTALMDSARGLPIPANPDAEFRIFRMGKRSTCRVHADVSTVKTGDTETPDSFAPRIPSGRIGRRSRRQPCQVRPARRGFEKEIETQGNSTIIMTTAENKHDEDPSFLG